MVVMVPKGCCATSPMRVTHAGGRTPVLGTDPPGHQGHGNVKQLNRRGNQGGSGISCNCFFMCVLSLRHGGVRMLLTREEKEVSYCVGYFYFFTVTYFYWLFLLWRKKRLPRQELALQNHLSQTQHTKLWHCSGLSLLQSAGYYISCGWQGQICQAGAWPGHQLANTNMLDRGHVLTFLKEQKHAFSLCAHQADSFTTEMSSVTTVAFSFLPPLLPTLCFLG